ALRKRETKLVFAPLRPSNAHLSARNVRSCKSTSDLGSTSRHASAGEDAHKSVTSRRWRSCDGTALKTWLTASSVISGTWNLFGPALARGSVERIKTSSW